MPQTILYRLKIVGNLNWINFERRNINFYRSFFTQMESKLSLYRAIDRASSSSVDFCSKYYRRSFSIILACKYKQTSLFYRNLSYQHRFAISTTVTWTFRIDHANKMRIESERFSLSLDLSFSFSALKRLKAHQCSLWTGTLQFKRPLQLIEFRDAWVW